MQSLELKIPPPLVAALIAVLMWGISTVTPPVDAPHAVRIFAATALALIGGGFDVAGVVSFYLAKTTVNPLKPDRASLLVTTGVYRVTRNPMYLGLLLILAAWTIFLASAWACAGLPLFVLYLNRFQIEPEERILSAKFGAAFAAYQSRVRRWL
jgi:protein-S-isoprenylcysteine O-methyltransferase Ste14